MACRSFRHIFLSIALLALPFYGVAQEQAELLRPVTSAWTVEVGSAHVTDSYLSPIHYSGWTVGLTYDRWQAMRFCPEKWVMNLNIHGRFSRTLNKAGNAQMSDFAVSASWGMLYRFDLMQNLRLRLGGSTTLTGGAIYLARNGNNPVSAKAALTVNLASLLQYNLRLGRLPITLSWQCSLPVFGMFFSPEYDELYYEIYLGNRKGLVHPAWWGNRFVIDNNVFADLRFGATALRIGYHGYVLNSKVSNIVTREYTHAFVLGISGEWMSIGPKGLSENARIISAFY